MQRIEIKLNSSVVDCTAITKKLAIKAMDSSDALDFAALKTKAPTTDQLRRMVNRNTKAQVVDLHGDEWHCGSVEESHPGTIGDSAGILA